jgi:hypothetical protein
MGVLMTAAGLLKIQALKPATTKNTISAIDATAKAWSARSDRVRRFGGPFLLIRVWAIMPQSDNSVPGQRPIST